MYYQVDSTKIISIFFKDGGEWKPFFGNSPSDSAYTTSVEIPPSEFTGSEISGYSAVVPESTHLRGMDFVVQLQGNAGDLLGASTIVEANGDVKITLSSVPLSNINVILVGSTTMSTPYSKLFDVSSWTALTPTEVAITIPQSEHHQVAGSIFLGIYENTVPSSTSAAPYQSTVVSTSISPQGDVTLTTFVGFSGKVVISGK